MLGSFQSFPSACVVSRFLCRSQVFVSFSSVFVSFMRKKNTQPVILLLAVHRV